MDTVALIVLSAAILLPFYAQECMPFSGISRDTDLLLAAQWLGRLCSITPHFFDEIMQLTQTQTFSKLGGLGNAGCWALTLNDPQRTRSAAPHSRLRIIPTS